MTNVPSLFTQFHEALMATPEDLRRGVDRLQAQAVAYVWGWQDAGGARKETDVSIDFGYAYGIVAAMHAQDKANRPDIASAWVSYQECGEIVNRATGRPFV